MDTLNCAHLRIARMQMPDIEPALDILMEARLESWNYMDFAAEIKREDSFVLVVKKEDKVIGFCVARLIISNICNSDNLTPTSKTCSTLTGQILSSTRENSLAEYEIYNIAVKREYRNQGIGDSLLKRLISLATERDARSIWLEVRNTNKHAFNFYKKNDFRQIYERKNFYSNPVEDAIVMKKNL